MKTPFALFTLLLTASVSHAELVTAQMIIPREFRCEIKLWEQIPVREITIDLSSAPSDYESRNALVYPLYQGVIPPGYPTEEKRYVTADDPAVIPGVETSVEEESGKFFLLETTYVEAGQETFVFDAKCDFPRPDGCTVALAGENGWMEAVEPWARHSRSNNTRDQGWINQKRSPSLEAKISLTLRKDGYLSVNLSGQITEKETPEAPGTSDDLTRTTGDLANGPTRGPVSASVSAAPVSAMTSTYAAPQGNGFSINLAIAKPLTTAIGAGHRFKTPLYFHERVTCLRQPAIETPSKP